MENLLITELVDNEFADGKSVSLAVLKRTQCDAWQDLKTRVPLRLQNFWIRTCADTQSMGEWVLGARLVISSSVHLFFYPISFLPLLLPPLSLFSFFFTSQVRGDIFNMMWSVRYTLSIGRFRIYLSAISQEGYKPGKIQRALTLHLGRTSRKSLEGTSQLYVRNIWEKNEHWAIATCEMPVTEFFKVIEK